MTTRSALRRSGDSAIVLPEGTELRMTSSARVGALVLSAVLVSSCDCGSPPPVGNGDAGRDAADDLGTVPEDGATRDLGAVVTDGAAFDLATPTDASAVDAGVPGPPPDLGPDVVTMRIFVPNARGELVDTVFAAPTTPGPHAAVLVAHGSGGLFRMPGATDTGTCSDRMESQFERWATRLVGLGFVVAMPDSFGSRGFCDFNSDPRMALAYPPITADLDGKTRRLVDRIYDADAVLRVLAARSDVRADRIGLLGFSNGASTVALYLHRRLPAAWDEFAASTDGIALGVSLPPLPAATVPVVTGVAYYPGCGFDGLLPFSTNLSNLDAFYYPASPLQILHASLDPLVDHCSITQTGTREFQADTYSQQRSVPDQYAITIYDGASHGFDSADCEIVDAGTDPDLAACREALPVTLGLLTPLLAP